MDDPEQSLAPSADGADTGPVALLLAKFSNAVDQKQPKEIASLFTPDAMFMPTGEPIQGPPAIETFYESRLGDDRRRTRHVWSNLIVRPMAKGRAHFEAVLTNYAFEPTITDGAVQVRIGNVWGVCSGNQPGEWRFETHYFERLYAAAVPLSMAPPPLTKGPKV
jgi:ketosteroid isomerase-like protein